MTLMSKPTLPPAEAYLSAIVSSSDDAIIAHDLDGTITLWNIAAEQLLGYPAADAIGQSTLMLFSGDRRDEEISILERVWKGEYVSHFETVLVARDGTRVDVSLTVSPILNESGQVVGASKIARDVRERRIAELAQLRLAALVQSSDDPIISKDLNGIVTSWNPAAERLFGYTAEEIIGKSITTIIPASRLAEEDYVLGRIRSGLPVEHFETVRQTKDGRLIDVSLTVSPIRTAAGKLIGASKIARDIGERKRADAAALQLGAIVESSDDAIVSKDLNGIVISWNASAERMFGYTAEEMIGQSITRIIPRDRLDEEAFVLGRVRAGARVEHFETVRQDKWGRPLEISLTVSPILAPDGRVVGASKIARDITRHKRLIESQREAQAREEAARRQVLEVENRRFQDGSRLKSEFVANMSHELRTPLNSMIGFAELMVDERLGPMPPKYAEFSSLILKSAAHLLQLINDILDLAKVESGKIDLKPERVQLPAVVEDVTSVVGGLARQRDVRIETAIDPDVGEIHLDPNRLKQVLYNYLSNAVKFSKEHGRVEVRVRADGTDGFRIEVEDWGIGIKAEDVNRLFVEFQQLDASTAKQYKGTGLGLSITKRIVEAQGGSVGVRTEFGTGSTFFAILPRNVTARSANVGWRETEPVG
jgi:PAS domain S-box-containing protein